MNDNLRLAPASTSVTLSLPDGGKGSGHPLVCRLAAGYLQLQVIQRSAARWLSIEGAAAASTTLTTSAPQSRKMSVRASAEAASSSMMSAKGFAAGMGFAAAGMDGAPDHGASGQGSAILGICRRK